MKELITLFEHHEVAYALVGGFAVNYYGYVRMTQDIDLLIYPSKENATKIKKCLEAFGFGQADIPFEYLERSGSAIHLGVEPNRIDLLTHLRGISNDHIFKNIKKVSIDGTFVNIIALNDLLTAKRNSERLKDQADAEELEKKQGDEQ
jgi:predicted nucleotidyltransferase